MILTPFVNSLPWSVTISRGRPKRQIHRFRIAVATVNASLLLMVTSSTYFVNASVRHKINFLSPDVVFNGPKRSAWIRWLTFWFLHPHRRKTDGDSQTSRFGFLLLSLNIADILILWLKWLNHHRKWVELRWMRSLQGIYVIFKYRGASLGGFLYRLWSDSNIRSRSFWWASLR